MFINNEDQDNAAYVEIGVSGTTNSHKVSFELTVNLHDIKVKLVF